MKVIIVFFGIIIFLVALTGNLFSQGGLDQRVAELSQQIAKEMTEYQKTTIAVVQFTDLDGNVPEWYLRPPDRPGYLVEAVSAQVQRDRSDGRNIALIDAVLGALGSILRSSGASSHSGVEKYDDGRSESSSKHIAEVTFPGGMLVSSFEKMYCLFDSSGSALQERYARVVKIKFTESLYGLEELAYVIEDSNGTVHVWRNYSERAINGAFLENLEQTMHMNDVTIMKRYHDMKADRLFLLVSVPINAIEKK